MTIPPAPSSLKRPLIFNLQRDLSSTIDSSLRICLHLSCLTFSITMSPPSNQTWRGDVPIHNAKRTTHKTPNKQGHELRFLSKKQFYLQADKIGSTNTCQKRANSKNKDDSADKKPKDNLFLNPPGSYQVRTKSRNSLTNTYIFALILRFWTSARRYYCDHRRPSN